jgi:rRNA-processing protein EBP2
MVKKEKQGEASMMCETPAESRSPRLTRRTPFRKLPFSPSSVMAASDLKTKRKKSKLITISTDQDESEDDENSGVDEEGLEKLMNALGEDGLDEYDLAQLRMLTGSAAGEERDEEEHDSDGEEDDVEAASASEEEEEKSGEEDEIALDDEDVGSVDQDVIPRRKVEVDNKVASPYSFLPSG